MTNVNSSARQSKVAESAVSAVADIPADAG